MLKKIVIAFFTLLMFMGSMAQNAMAKNYSINEFLDLISEAKGKQVVFVNFFASWCPPCREEVPHIIELRNTYSDEELLIFGVNLDQDVKTFEEFVEKMGINYTTTHDNGEIQQFFRVSSIPFNIIYAKDGRAVYAKPGLISATELKKTISYAMEN